MRPRLACPSIIAAVLTIQWCIMAQTDPGQGQRRDMARYSAIGPFTLENALEKQDRDRIEASVRQFLWQNYTKKHLARVTVTRYSREGDRSVTAYFVEPDDTGKWLISLAVDRVLADARYPGQRFSSSERLSAYTVERIVRQSGRDTMLPASDLVPPERYVLRLIDHDGRLLQTL